VAVLGGCVEDHIDSCLCREMIDPRSLWGEHEAGRVDPKHTIGKGERRREKEARPRSSFEVEYGRFVTLVLDHHLHGQE
jgi:hypothetical protein